MGLFRPRLVLLNFFYLEKKVFLTLLEKYLKLKKTDLLTEKYVLKSKSSQIAMHY